MVMTILHPRKSFLSSLSLPPSLSLSLSLDDDDDDDDVGEDDFVEKCSSLRPDKHLSRHFV